MGALVDAINTEDRIEGLPGVQQNIPASRDLNPAEEGTNRAAAAIGETERPSLNDSLEKKEVARESNPGLEATRAMLLYEKNAIKQLRGTEVETNKELRSIDQLLNLSSELSALGDKDKHELSEKVQSIINELKEKGVDLLKGDPKQITKEQLIELKSTISSHVDKSRTKVQQIFTKMQNIIQNMMSVNDTSKRFLSDFLNMIRTILRNMRPN